MPGDRILLHCLEPKCGKMAQTVTTKDAVVQVGGVTAPYIKMIQKRNSGFGRIFGGKVEVDYWLRGKSLRIGNLRFHEPSLSEEDKNIVISGYKLLEGTLVFADKSNVGTIRCKEQNIRRMLRPLADGKFRIRT